jgi:RNA polymerase sigma factor (TIGR02999 family)
MAPSGPLPGVTPGRGQTRQRAVACNRRAPLPSTITQLLQAHGAGDHDAVNRLVPLLYQDLRRIARIQLRRRAGQDSLDTAGLVHEAYLRLVDQSRAEWRDRGHFLAVAAIAMRQIAVDHVRRRLRVKRGGSAAPVPLDSGHASRDDWEKILAVDLALQKLEAADARLARVVECRYFAGLSEDETAAALGVSLRTAQREWFKARAWLRAELGGGRP